MSGLYLEDYTVGRVFETAPVTLEADEIIWFARQYDPQPFHTDPETAKDTVFGGLIASGWHTGSVLMSLLALLLQLQYQNGTRLSTIHWIMMA